MDLVRAGGVRSTAQVEEARERDLRLHARVLESMVEGVSVCTEDGIIVYTNPAEDAMFGYARGEMLGKHVTIQNAYPPEENLRIVRGVMRELRERGRWEGEFHNVRKDGSRFFTHARITTVELDGRPHWVSVQEDVTERRQLETRERENERRLAESEARFRTLVMATTQMVWKTDAQGLVDDLPEWREVTGQTYEEVRGAGWATAVHPDDRDRVAAVWGAAFAARAPYVCEYRVRTKAGDYRHFQARAVPRCGPDGELIEYIGTWTDVTAQAEALVEAENLRAQLARGEKLAALGSLVSGVAHEVRTPLTFLANNAFLLQHRLEKAARSGADVKELAAALLPLVDEMASGVDRINQLVEDLRRYTRSQTAEAVEAPLHTFVLDAVELFRATHAGGSPVSASFDLTAPVRANRGGVQQIVLNLLQNAAEASPAGSPVAIVVRQDGDTPVLEVVDRGSGIPPGVKERMFEPLFTTKREGTGLGLSIVRRIADQHAARVECETETGVGTTFRVRFPRAKA